MIVMTECIFYVELQLSVQQDEYTWHFVRDISITTVISLSIRLAFIVQLRVLMSTMATMVVDIRTLVELWNTQVRMAAIPHLPTE